MRNFYLWIRHGPPRNTYTGVPRPDSFARMQGVLISWREHFPTSFENLFRAVFTWQSKVSFICIGLTSVRCAIGSKKVAPLFQPIRSIARTCFRALSDSYVYALWVLIGSLYFLCFLFDWPEWSLWVWFCEIQLKTALWNTNVPTFIFCSRQSFTSSLACLVLHDFASRMPLF